ncbi:hypothetical protein ABW20_dc0109610 [Dactylellina cionopaga]|nr:hypothetical protein ABW20_dc0109610 [Dactylellina cionopaga]
MMYLKTFFLLGSVGFVSAYRIGFTIQGYDHSKPAGTRVDEAIYHDIPGLPGRNRCFNIISPIFDENTPIGVSRLDKFRGNNRIGAEQKYYYPDTLRHPDDPVYGFVDIAPLMAEEFSRPLPDIEISEITVESILDLSLQKRLGASGPPPAAIALYTRRNCVNNANIYNPVAIIRFYTGNGSQTAEMVKMLLKNQDGAPSATLEAQSWEELDEDSNWWSKVIAGRPVSYPEPKLQLDSESELPSFLPDRVMPGDGYVIGNDPWRKNVVDMSGLYFADDEDVLQSLEDAEAQWPGITDYGYFGDDRMNPQVRPTGDEYLSDNWVPNAQFSEAYDIMQQGADDSDTEETWTFNLPNADVILEQQETDILE